MEFTKSLLSLALCGLFMVSCKDSAANAEVESAADATVTKSDAPAGKMETANFNIDGMSCAVGCAKTLEKKLAGLDGVQDVTVDFDKKSATVKYDSSRQTPEKLAETVESAADGKTYKVSNVKSSGDQAMVFYQEKDKKKKSNKKTATAETKTSEAKPACCSAKKACHKDEQKTL